MSGRDLSQVEEEAGLLLFKKETELRAASGATASGATASSGRHGLTLQDLSLLKVTLSWQEGVAVMLEVLHGLPDGSACPDPALVTLSPTGETRVLSGPPLSGPAVGRAATFLAELLSTANAPAELRALLDRDRVDPPEHTSLAEFAQGLSYFERPNRRGDAAAVHARALTLYVKSTADLELERLRARAALNAGPPQEPRRPFALRLSPGLLNAALVALLCAIIGASGIALVGVATGWSSPLTSRSGSDAEGEAASSMVLQAAGAMGKQLISSGLAAAGIGTASAPAPSAPTAPVHTPGSRSARPDRLRASARRGGDAASVTVQPPQRTPPDEEDREWTVSVRDLTASELRAMSELTASGDGATIGRLDESLPIFSGENSDVAPASLVRPQLPSQPDHATPAGMASLFDLIISEAGAVEHVRLISPGNRFNDRMLTSAAKAWQFQPALKDGRPVRYRLRLRITP